MKTNQINKAKGLLNRADQQLNPNKTMDYRQRQANRSLTTESLLALLQAKAPDFFKLAEVVGQWVWIQFEQKQPGKVTAALAQLGFHWNRNRQAWQHPCGLFRDQSSPIDPRQKYGSYFAADRA